MHLTCTAVLEVYYSKIQALWLNKFFVQTIFVRNWLFENILHMKINQKMVAIIWLLGTFLIDQHFDSTYILGRAGSMLKEYSLCTCKNGENYEYLLSSFTVTNNISSELVI